jgi:hypothetical protein
MGDCKGMFAIEGGQRREQCCILVLDGSIHISTSLYYIFQSVSNKITAYFLRIQYFLDMHRKMGYKVGRNHEKCQ